jgi:uncharacterized protein
VGKLIVLVIIVLVVMFVLKSYLRGVESKRQASAPGPANDNAANTMVRCAQCGVHVPRSEGILSRSKFFCSDEHRLVHFK